jgi:hypothetical protein
MESATPRTIRTVPPELSRSDLRNEVKEEGNLLIEAVSLLVQRQRETESWVAEQIWQAEERATAAERRYGELEERLVGIEQHLARLVQDVEPSAADQAMAEQLTRLREQVEGLKADADSPAARTVPVAEAPTRPLPSVEARPPAHEVPHIAHETRSAAAQAPRPAGRVPAVATTPGAPSASVGFWDLLGATPQDRAGVLLIGAGGVAVLYAILTQLKIA